MKKNTLMFLLCLISSSVFSSEKTPVYSFQDCNGKTFTTDQLKNNKVSKDQRECAYQGMFDTKFDYNGSVDGLKSINQMSPKEYLIFQGSSLNNDRAQFAIAVHELLKERASKSIVDQN